MQFRGPAPPAKVEAGVLVAERWILARLRHQQFFALAELNARIAELLVDPNARVMRRYGQSRRQLCETLDRPALEPLPAARFTYAEWKRVRVNIDYHVALDRQYYSAPFQHVHLTLDARVTASTVELFHKGERVASHARSSRPGAFVTAPAHMPKSHQKHLEWTPSRLITWARTVGPEIAALVETILADRPHPEQGSAPAWASCAWSASTALSAPSVRVPARWPPARGPTSTRYHPAARPGRLTPPAPPAAPAPAPVDHEQVRGRQYYH